MRIIHIVSLLALTASVMTAQTAEEIVRKSEDLLKGKSSYGTFSMTVTTPEYTRTMKMESWWVGTEKALILIESPKKEAGNKTLKIKNEMWNYLRATETVIKLPPSMMLQAWNGSDFTNDDIVRESSIITDYAQTIIAEELINDEMCWKILLTPHPEAAVVWGKLYYWVRKIDYLPSVTQFFDEKGQLVRYMVYSDFRMLGGRKIPAVWTIYNKVKPGHRTEFVMHEVEFDPDIPDRIFSFRELERGN